jgi:hypothetical protein
MALRYDNKYTGEISAVTTKGSAVFQIRAAGEPGKHIIQLKQHRLFARRLPQHATISAGLYLCASR